VSGIELLNQAITELYASDLDVFTDRRRDLAARARAAGERAVAKEIAGLRKPTRSAWAVNRLVRADPSVPPRLAALGDELRAAEAALDGARIRELSLARRQLVSDLTRQALNAPGQPAPSAALREEVSATFGAALADPQVAEQLAAATLLRAVHRAGFSSPGAPALELVPPPEAGRPPATPTPTPAPAAHVAPAQSVAPGPAGPPESVAPAGPAGASAAASAARRRAAAASEAAAAAAARAERVRRAVAAAQQELAEASLAAGQAAEAERELLAVVQRLEERLAEARQHLFDARYRAREAITAQRKAQQTLDRLRK
jgi:hypothetical protein